MFTSVIRIAGFANALKKNGPAEAGPLQLPINQEAVFKVWSPLFSFLQSLRVKVLGVTACSTLRLLA